MNKFSVIFTNSYGKIGFIIEAETQEQAIQKAIKKDLVKSYYCIEAVLILDTY